MSLRNIILSCRQLDLKEVERNTKLPWLFVVPAIPQTSGGNGKKYQSRIFYKPDMADLIASADESREIMGDTHHIYLEDYSVTKQPYPDGTAPGEITLHFGS